MNPAQMISIAHGDLKSLESELNEANAKLAEANKKLAARKAEPQPQPPPSTQDRASVAGNPRYRP